MVFGDVAEWSIAAGSNPARPKKGAYVRIVPSPPVVMPVQRAQMYGDEQANCLACVCDSKGAAYERRSGLQDVGESYRLRQL